MRIGSILLTGIMLLIGGVLGPTACRAPELSQVSAESIRVRSLVQSTSRRRSGGGVYFGGSSSSSRSGSSRYSSGGGFSSGK